MIPARNLMLLISHVKPDAAHSGLSCETGSSVSFEATLPQKVVNLAERLETQGTAFLAVSRSFSAYKNAYRVRAGLLFGGSYFQE